MVIGILRESSDRRVAVTPAILPKIKALGFEAIVEKGAGKESFFLDEHYAEHAELVDRATVLARADLIATVNPIPETEMASLKLGVVLISQFQPYNEPAVVDMLKKYGARAYSLDMVPRSTIAQSVDVLSSMASVAGYESVLAAAKLLPRYFPMMITAAGSIPPAKVLVLGAGVAGLQAIATARRLGASVEAFDTRLAAKEEVESLGARFVMVEGAADDKAAGGYAVEQSDEYKRKQTAEIQARAIKSDVIITTAQLRGKKAPILVTADTVAAMRPGSVIVDLAASTGGNCELTKNGETISVHGVSIIGNSSLADEVPQDASTLYANNVLSFLKFGCKDGTFHTDSEHEVIKSSFITQS